MEVQAKQFEIKRNTFIYTSQLDNDNMDSNIIESIEKTGDQQNQSTNVKAQMTYWRMQKSLGFSELKLIIDKVIEQIFIERSNYRKHLGTPFLRDMWGVKYKENNFAKKHNHWPAIFSFVYYPSDCLNTNLYFEEIDLRIETKKGLLIIFDSFLHHQVETINEDVIRYSVAGNYF